MTLSSRRDFLRSSTALAAAALAPSWLRAQQGDMAGIVTTYRTLGAKTPVNVTPLAPSLYLLQGVGGNMVACTGKDGTVLVDTSVQTAAPLIAQALTSVKAAPLAMLINTHWHFDHTDGNAPLHTAGARDIIAHENTLKRLSAPQYMEALNVHFAAAPVAGRPTRTFAESNTLNGNGQSIKLQHFAPAHTDSDIYVFFPEANVLHVGDIWFNGFYPLIDYSSGGSLPGMVSAADVALQLAKPDTKIIPGHGPLGDRAALERYRDMLAVVQDRLSKLKAAGRTQAEIVAAKPTADLDAAWGKGPLTPDVFVTIAYKSLEAKGS